jgi:SAM-dependent methyltransferase
MVEASKVIRNQATHHFLMQTERFANLEELEIHLRHLSAYELASRLVRGKRVLDFGCNNGYGTALLAPTAHHIVGIDVSPSALMSARKQFRGQALNLVRIDGQKLPFVDCSFDVVLSFQVLEHIPDYPPYLSEIRRVLSPEGIFILTTPNARQRLEPGQSPWNQFHVHEFVAEELRELLSQWFPHAHVSGLTAQPEMYEVEQRRLARIRANATRIERAVRQRATVARAVKGLLPAKCVKLLGSLENILPKRSGPKAPPTLLDAATIAAHSTNDFYLDDVNVEDAIDLFGVCSVQSSMPATLNALREHGRSRDVTS